MKRQISFPLQWILFVASEKYIYIFEVLEEKLIQRTMNKVLKTYNIH